MSKPIRLNLLDIDPATERHLLSLAQRHLKLVLEISHRRTSSQCRAECFLSRKITPKNRVFLPIIVMGIFIVVLSVHASSCNFRLQIREGFHGVLDGRS